LITPIVECDGVDYRDGAGREILLNLNFRIAPGSLQFLTGPSGAGKSTLLRLLALALQPSRGTLKLFGNETSMLRGGRLTATRRRIGYVFDDLRLIDHLTPYENVALPLRLRGQDETTFRAPVTEALAWAGLRASQHQDLASLPAGERQAVAFARAIVTAPDLILADEPASLLDDTQTRRLFRMVEELGRQGTTIVIATQSAPLLDQSDMPRLILSEGRVLDYV
jgi:cell division transport system ATP-binding protein